MTRWLSNLPKSAQICFHFFDIAGPLENEISDFLDLISSISKAEYKDIEPLYHAPEILSHMREDVSIEVRDSGINCAPEHENSLIIVPKVIE